MPIYQFECVTCKYVYEIFGHMSDPPQPFSCERCQSPDLTRRIFGARVEVFKPFIDIHTTGKPIHIETRKERENHCNEHGVTFDSGRYVRKPQYKSVVDSITMEDIRKHQQEHGPGKETLYRGPIELDT